MMIPLFKAARKRTLLFILLPLLVALTYAFITIKENQPLNRKDALLIKNYELEVKKHIVEGGEKLAGKKLETAFRESGASIHTTVTYSPDSTFKIFVVKIESCGSSCNSEWFSWMHFNLHKKEVVLHPDFAPEGTGMFFDIEHIYLLPDKRYLVFENISGSESANRAHSCDKASVISFNDRNMNHHPLNDNGMNTFVGCTSFPREGGEEWEPYLKYDTATREITYAYADEGYTDELWIDTLHEGRFRYVKGGFFLEKESTTISYKRVGEE